MNLVIKAVAAVILLACAASAETGWNVDVLGAHRAGPSRAKDGSIYIPAKDVITNPADVQAVPAPYLQQPKFNVQSGKYMDVAREILELNAKSEPHASVYQAMLDKLPGVKIVTPERGTNFPVCVKRPDMLAVTLGTYIYICRGAVSRLTSQEAAQVVIHEMAHVLGYFNECDATRFEITAMRKAKREFFVNCYAEQCGLI